MSYARHLQCKEILILNLQERTSVISKLGAKLDEMPLATKELAQLKNQWFTTENINYCCRQWNKALDQDEVEKWSKDVLEPKTVFSVGIIMAGNIPMVGLHDLLAVLISGHKAIVKRSSKDEVLMDFVIESLIAIDPQVKDYIEVVDRFKGVDAVIATGSNNSARYFDYYFGGIPNIIRKNRTSVAVITGDETESELKALADDVFLYYGLGCRNVTKLLLTKNAKITTVLDAFGHYAHLIDHHKYANNYTYHKAIFLMNLTEHLDTGYLLVKEDDKLHSPLATIFYEQFDSLTEISEYIDRNELDIQTSVGNPEFCKTRFGSSQQTLLSDYADNVNTLKFLSKLT